MLLTSPVLDHVASKAHRLGKEHRGEGEREGVGKLSTKKLAEKADKNMQMLMSVFC
jgi:hypothetical protein